MGGTFGAPQGPLCPSEIWIYYATLFIHYSLGVEYQGNKLNITEDMIGDSQWTCIAYNMIQAKRYQVEIEVHFTVGKLCVCL